MRRLGRRVRQRGLSWTRPLRRLSGRSYGKLVDYHIHTHLCGHAVGVPVDYVRSARALGLSEIGFSDHMPLLRTRDEHLTMAPEDLPVYVDLVRDIQTSAQELTVRLGIEMDYIPGQMDEIHAEAEPFGFDYVIGSVHSLGGWDLSDSRYLSSWKGKDPDEVFPRYFEAFVEAVEEGGFDFMAHPDLVKKHGILPRRPMTRWYELAAGALAANDVAIEINTSGIRKRIGEPYPTLAFLAACVEAGVAVTLGSDAHAPGQVGMDFDVALRLLRRAGITEIATFDGRRRGSRVLP
ncbi:MAG: histidinol-phosphatase HisJ family protein [Candidatus Eisenbacteria bacterium]|nr:histidinol-phosphatase HisJ family protein [Candidatus Eisenbacteria bacterium]